MIKSRYGTFLTRAEYVKAWRKVHWNRIRNKVYEQTKAWNAAHPEVRKGLVKSWRNRNKERVRHYYRNRRKTHIQTMLSHRLSSRISSVLKRRRLYKNNTTVSLIGIDLEGFKRHLESIFLSGMTWDNRGLWHIDHIKPCSSFDLSDIEQQKRCFHYTNLQPLWWRDNLSKSDKLP